MNHHPQHQPLPPNPPTSQYGYPIYAYPPLPPPPPPRRLLLTLLLRAIIISGIILGLIILILWMIYRPQRMHVAVSSASLRAFNLSAPDATGSRFLSFDLSANLTLRNPNKRVGIYYDLLQAHAVYDDQQIGSAVLPGFYQGNKESTDLPTQFTGRSSIAVGDGGAEFRRENASGYFPVDLWVFGKVRYKFGSSVTRRYVMRARCELKVPMGKVIFSRTDCDVGF